MVGNIAITSSDTIAYAHDDGAMDAAILASNDLTG
jgi:hypothetical protein